jgi:hypothetical protein
MSNDLDLMLANMSTAMDKDNYAEASNCAQSAIEYLEMKNPDSSISSDWDRRTLLDMLYEVKKVSAGLIESGKELDAVDDKVIAVKEGDGVLVDIPMRVVPVYSQEEKTALIDTIVSGNF